MRALVMASGILILSGAWSRAEACACPATPPAPNLTSDALATWERENTRREITVAFDQAFAVFSGEVIEDEGVRVRIRRDRAWKGILPDKFFMQTGATRLPDGSLMTSSCDFYLAAGQRFLIFAYGDSLEHMRTGACSFSMLLRHAAAIIEILDAIVKERAERDRNHRKGQMSVTVDGGSCGWSASSRSAQAYVFSGKATAEPLLGGIVRKLASSRSSARVWTREVHGELKVA